MDDFGKYLRFKVTNTFWKGTESEQGKEDFQTTKEYTSADIVMSDENNIYPKLYIGD